MIQLSFALLKYFDDSNWQDKHNGKIPSSINRHWLVHSMYDYDDIKRADCIKLFCILFQMVELYSLEEKRHLRNDYGFRCKARLSAENICVSDTTVKPRKDMYLFEYEAVNEAVLNALVHNDWIVTEPQTTI